MSAVPLPGITIEAFETGQIDVECFDHEAHVYLAWLYLERMPVMGALQRYSRGLRRLTRQLGIPGKYHETITCFYLFMIAERRDGSAADWAHFKRRNDDLFARGEKSVLYKFYSREALASERARNTFVLPDRLAERSVA